MPKHPQIEVLEREKTEVRQLIYVYGHFDLGDGELGGAHVLPNTYGSEKFISGMNFIFLRFVKV